MAKEIKLIVDSIFEDLARVITSTNIRDKKTFDMNVQNLAHFLKQKRIEEGRSYRINFSDTEDLTNLQLGKIDKNYKPKGKIEIRDTTKSDLKKVRNLQEKLGLR